MLLRRQILITCFIFLNLSLAAQTFSLHGSVKKAQGQARLYGYTIKNIQKDTTYYFFGNEFKMDSLNENDSLFLICSEFCRDSIISINNYNRNDSINIKLTSTCPYDYNKKFCKKCKSKKNIIKILYGLISYDLEREILYSEYESGSCDVSNCQPHWFCKKCKSRF